MRIGYNMIRLGASVCLVGSSAMGLQSLIDAVLQAPFNLIPGAVIATVGCFAWEHAERIGYAIRERHEEECKRHAQEESVRRRAKAAPWRRQGASD